MGVTFRSGGYIRHVRIGHRTIKDGEAAAVWNSKGVHTQIIGPKRVTLWFSTIRFLDRYKAEAHQYIEIKYRNGKIDHVCGPYSVYMNPSIHDSMKIKSGIQLATEKDCIVVFKSQREIINTPKDSSLTPNGISCTEFSSKIINPFIKRCNHPSERRIIRGPTVFFPEVDETIHVFKWTLPSNDLLSEMNGNTPHTTTTTPALTPYENGHRYSSNQRRCTDSSDDDHCIILDHVDCTPNSFQILSIGRAQLWKTKVPFTSIDRDIIKVTVGITYYVDSIEKVLTVTNPISIIEAALLSDFQRFKGDEDSISDWIHDETSFKNFKEAISSTGLLLGKIQVLHVENLSSKISDSKNKKKIDMNESHEKAKLVQTMYSSKLEFLKGMKDIGVDLTKVLCASQGNVDKILKELDVKH